MQLSWSDPRLSVASDSRRTARHRLQQSWYREQILRARYGEYRVSAGTRPLGSLLHVDDVRRDPGLNFLSPAAGRYAEERAAIVAAAGGHVDRARLTRNMLSSLPLTFSVFGEIREQPHRGLEVVRAFFDPAAVAVDLVECEWRPAIDLLGDRSAFDAAIVTVRADGSRHLIGIEAKYVEPFNRTIYNSEPYRRVHDGSGWFEGEATLDVIGPATNQLWRRTLLAAACVQHEVMGITSASLVVVCPAGDPNAAIGVAGMSSALREPESHCRVVSLESLVAGLREGIDPGPQWADAFALRYLDPPLIPAELPDFLEESEQRHR